MRYTKSESYNPGSKQAACVGANGVCPAQLGLAKADSVLVVQKLQQRPEQFTVRGFTRSEQKANDLFGTFQMIAGLLSDQQVAHR